VDRITSIIAPYQAARMDLANVNANKRARGKVGPRGFNAAIDVHQVKLGSELLRTEKESARAPTIQGR